MSTRADEAVNRKHCGHNCSQAVACAFCDYTGLDEETLKETTQAFAVGMGTMEGNCGALTGAGLSLIHILDVGIMAAGIIYSRKRDFL